MASDHSPTVALSHCPPLLGPCPHGAQQPRSLIRDTRLAVGPSKDCHRLWQLLALLRLLRHKSRAPGPGSMRLTGLLWRDHGGAHVDRARRRSVMEIAAGLVLVQAIDSLNLDYRGPGFPMAAWKIVVGFVECSRFVDNGNLPVG